MDASQPMKFVPAEGVHELIMAPIPPERKVAILMVVFGHDQKLEGLETLIANNIIAQISRYNDKYNEAVKKRKERQAEYYRRRKQMEGDDNAHSTPTDVERRRTTSFYPPESESESETESESESESESPQSPPAGGITRPTVDPVRSADEAPEKKDAAPPAQPEGRTRHFRAPSAEEVAAYAASRGEAIDAERFVDFYASKGWKVGRAPMRDWQAAVRNWLRDRGDFVSQKKDAAPPAQTPDPLAMPAAETAAERMERWAREAAAARAAAGTEPAAAAGGRE